MKHLLFFAIKDDLLPVLQAFEATKPVKYIRTDTLTTCNYVCFERGAAIPNLGNASNASAIGCESFLVCERGIEINLRRLKPLTNADIDRRSILIGGQEIAVNPQPLNPIVGLERFAIDQLVNPDTVVFTPGGVWNEEILLHGRIATASESDASQNLMKRFQSALKKHFTKIKAFYVGPGALALLKSGKRLTASEQSPREFDLTIS
jgi:hypothetical protein